MKKHFKKILTLAACLCLIIGGAFTLTACGEQFIEEREYNLTAMQIIKHNVFDRNMTDKLFYSNLLLEDCTVDVGRKTSVFKYDDSDESGIVATFTFKVYTNSKVYPAYAFSSYKVTMNGSEIDLFGYDTSTPDYEYGRSSKIEDLQKFTREMLDYDTSLQIVTQNKSFTCHLVELNKTTGDLAGMALIYGY